MIIVTDLAYDGPAGPVFRLAEVVVPAEGLTLLHGPAGSGRSAALLALSGRLAGVRGSARFDRLDLVRDAAKIRRRSAVARVAGLVDLEPRLSVEESITERALTEGVSPATADRAVRRTETQLDHARLDRTALVETLGGRERFFLTLALGCVRPAELIIVDDVDAGLDDADRSWAFAALHTVAGDTAVLATAILTIGAPDAAHLIDLSPITAEEK